MKSITGRVLGLCKSYGLGALGVLLALWAVVSPPPPDPPPPPFAHLVCATDGLPDLEVVCSTSKSRNFRTGTLFFSYDDRIDIDTIVTGPPPRNWFKRFWDRISGQDSSDLGTIVAASKVIHRKRYKEPGDYQIDLILSSSTGESDSARATITVQESPKLNRELVLTELLLEKANDDIPIHSFEYRINQAQYENRFFVDTTRKYTRIIQANEGWKLIECAFDKGLRSRRASYERSSMSRFEFSDDRSEARFSFWLTSKKWLFDGRDAWLQGVVTCHQAPTDQTTEETDQTAEEQVGRKEELRIERTGVIEVDVGSESTTFEKDSIRNWSFKQGGKQYNVAFERASEPVRLSSQNVELSIVDPPMLEPADLRSKVWLKVSQNGMER